VCLRFESGSFGLLAIPRTFTVEVLRKISLDRATAATGAIGSTEPAPAGGRWPQRHRLPAADRPSSADLP
jgi:hypothetical protein